MFDDVQCDAMRCPLCNAVMGWQSKDGPCLLETLTVHELVDQAGSPSFYASCRDCRVWVEVSVRRQQTRTAAQWKQFYKEKALIEERRGSDERAGQ